MAWTSRPNVSRCFFERLVSVSSRTGGTDVSVSSQYRHSKVLVSSLQSLGLVSRRLDLGIIRLIYNPAIQHCCHNAHGCPQTDTGGYSDSCFQYSRKTWTKLRHWSGFPQDHLQNNWFVTTGNWLQFPLTFHFPWLLWCSQLFQTLWVTLSIS